MHVFSLYKTTVCLDLTRTRGSSVSSLLPQWGENAHTLKLNQFSWCFFKHQLFSWLTVWDHVGTSVCSQHYWRTLFPDSLQPSLCYVAAEIHMERSQWCSVEGHCLQGVVSDLHTVLQFEALQVWAVLEKLQNAVICNMATSREGQRQQIWTSESRMVTGEMGEINHRACRSR